MHLCTHIPTPSLTPKGAYLACLGTEGILVPSTWDPTDQAFQKAPVTQLSVSCISGPPQTHHQQLMVQLDCPGTLISPAKSRGRSSRLAEPSCIMPGAVVQAKADGTKTQPLTEACPEVKGRPHPKPSTKCLKYSQSTQDPEDCPSGLSVASVLCKALVSKPGGVLWFTVGNRQMDPF